MVSVPIFPPKAIAFFRTDSVFSSLQPVVYPAGKHATAVGRACFLTGGMVPGVAEWGVVLGGCFGSMFSSLRSAGGLLRLGEHPQPASPLASPCQARPCGPTSPSSERGFEDCGAWKERSLWRLPCGIGWKVISAYESCAVKRRFLTADRSGGPVGGEPSSLGNGSCLAILVSGV